MDRGLVLFDLDGTLADTLEDLTASINRILARRRAPAAPPDLVRRHVGHGVRKLLSGILSVQGEEQEGAVREFLLDYGERCLDRTALYPGVREGLKALEDVPKVILSNKPVAMCVKIAEALGIAGSFLAIHGGDSGAGRKPDPEAVLGILKSHGASAARSVLVGDSQVDRDAARAAGLRFCAIEYGYGEPEGLEGAHARAKDFPDAVRAVRTLLGSPAGPG